MKNENLRPVWDDGGFSNAAQEQRDADCERAWSVVLGSAPAAPGADPREYEPKNPHDPYWWDCC